MATIFKTALVTGGSNGIGKAVVNMLLSNNVKVCFSYFSDDKAADEIIHKANKDGIERAFSVKADIGSEDGIEHTFQSAIDRLGKIDILVNNAGVFIDHSFLENDTKSFDRTIDVILKGTFFLTQKVAQQMIDNKIHGRIINISSLVTLRPIDSPVDYIVAKSGINGFTKAVAADLGRYGITRNAVLPGAIPTKINKWQFDNPIYKEKFKNGSVLHELGDPNYIAGAVEYLISKEAKWTTGILVSVDGGYSI